MEASTFGYWLRRKRKSLDLTREALAERVGYSAATIRKIEDEERRPSAQIVEQLAELFQIPENQRPNFLRFARGDWQAAPAESGVDAPWLNPSSPVHDLEEASEPKVHLATFLYTDIEGSAKLWEQAPEKMKVALQRHHKILEEAVTSNGGAVFQIVGDAFCAAFPTVIAAVSAAVTAQRELQQEQWDTPFPIRVRMGIHTGEAERSSNPSLLEGYASNQTLNRVARILRAAHGGQVLLSLATADLVKEFLPGNTQLRDMGEHSLKHLSHPEHLFQLRIAGLPSDFPPLNTLTHRHNLPVQVTSFIACEAEIALVQEYLSQDDIRLVTLLGPPGIGKTRLSIEAARACLPDFSDGVSFVALALVEDPSVIAAATAQALGYVGAKNISTTEQLKEGLGKRNLLLVLDNCEHLIDAVALLASDLLSACPHLKMLATSRESLRIPGEWLYAVPAFDLPAENSSFDVESVSQYPAVRLFAERARAVRSDFSLNTNNIETIAAICSHLDGLPLVIELIAARLRLMTPQALLERLSGQFVLTADGMRAASERQRTLHNAIEWSYNLLPPEEKKLFAYLSVFSGGFTLEAVESLFSHKVSEKPLSNLIALLLDKSLIRLAPDLGASGEPRYTMLVTIIQQYARECLQARGEETEIHNEHLGYFLELAEMADKELRGHQQLAWLGRLNSDRDNLRTALDWVIETEQTEAALRLVRKLHWFWFVHGDHNEGCQWLERVLGMASISLYPNGYAEALTQWAHHVYVVGHRSELEVEENRVIPLAEQALSIARAHGDKHNTARALAMLGLALALDRRFREAQSALEESKLLFQEVHDEWGAAHAGLVLAFAAYLQADWSNSLALNAQSFAGFSKVGDRYFKSVTLRYIGIVQIKQGDFLQGELRLQEALILAQQLGSKYEIAGALSRLGEAAQLIQRSARAVILSWAAKNVYDSIGIWQRQDETRFNSDLAPYRAMLGESVFAEAEAKGRSMTMEQAIAYALSNDD